MNRPVTPADIRPPAFYDDDRGRWQKSEDLPDPLEVCLHSYDKSQVNADEFEKAVATQRLRLWATIAVSLALAAWGIFCIYLVSK